MDLDPETMARFLGAICRQAIRDHRADWREPGYPDATRFLQVAGLLHPDRSVPRTRRRGHAPLTVRRGPRVHRLPLRSRPAPHHGQQGAPAMSVALPDSTRSRAGMPAEPGVPAGLPSQLRRAVPPSSEHPSAWPSCRVLATDVCRFLP